MSEIIKKEGNQILEDGMMGFSAYVLLQRAIPSLEDGLKISYRRIIYSMYKNKIFNFTKSLNVVGEVAKIHPHGSVYPTIVGMSQKDRHIIPFIEGKGYFGDYTSRDVEASAERYTNVKLPDFSKNLLKNLNKDSVNMIKSYDGTTEIPEFLPVTFPIGLIFAQSGMGVGFSSSTVGFNVGDVADAVVDYVDGKPHKNIIPDFATGGMLLKDDEVIDNINKTGRGSIRLRGTAKINGREISITEIPYSTTREAIIDKVIELAKTDKLSEVTNIQDLTGQNGMEILVTARRGTDMGLLLEKLYELTPLQSSYSVNSTFLVDGLPKRIGVIDIIKHWVKWRTECIKKELAYDIKKLENRLFEVNILEKLTEKKIKKLIELIRKGKNKTKTIKDIRESFDLTFAEADFLYDLKINQLNTTYINNKIKEKEEIQSNISELKDKIENPNNVIKEDMREFKRKYNQERRTKIIEIEKIEEKRQKVADIIKKDMIESGEFYITITENHYLHKTKNKFTPKNGDKIILQYKLDNVEDEIFCFTKSRDGFKAQIHTIEEYSGKGLGLYLPSFLKVDKDNIVNYGISSKNYPIILLFLSKGRVIKLSYESYRAGVNVFANTHTDKFELVDAVFLGKESKIQVEYSNKKQKTFNTKDIRFTKSRNATGQYLIPSNRNEFTNIKVK